MTAGVGVGHTFFFRHRWTEPWKSDGTPEGTVLAADIYRGPESSDPGMSGLCGDHVDRLAVIGQTVFFAADDGIHGRELWSVTVVPSDLVLPGDCNSDGQVDISDASCILTYLFLDRTARLPCGDGSREEESNRLLMSWNGAQAEVDLSAVVRLLGHLFLGGPGHALGAECVPIAGCPVACQTGT